MKKAKEWVEFYLEGKRIAAYTVQGSFEGEMEATIELLAHDHGVPKEAISVKYETR